MKWLFCGFTKENIEVFTCLDDDDFEYIKKFSTFLEPKTNIPMFYDYNLKKMQRIHRFCSMASPGEKVVHLNGHTYDNRKENLIIIKNSKNIKKTNTYPVPNYDEKREAIAYRFWISSFNLKNLSANKKSKQISNSLGEVFNNVKEASKAHGIPKSVIYSVTSGHRNTHKGIKWFFKTTQS